MLRFARSATLQQMFGERPWTAMFERFGFLKVASPVPPVLWSEQTEDARWTLEVPMLGMGLVEGIILFPNSAVSLRGRHLLIQQSEHLCTREFHAREARERREKVVLQSAGAESSWVDLEIAYNS